eukprot:gene317-biopygen292
MSVTVDMEKVMAFLQPQFDAFDTAAVAGTISAEACQALKTDILKSAVEKAHKEALEVLHGKSSEEYTTAYVDRNPWVKDLQNARDTWQRHFTAIQRNAKQWEEKVRSAYMAKAKSGTLSPLLALIGEYLLYSSGKEAGRQSLLEILYLQEPSKRLSIHNWHILDLVSGATETHGPKVERLKMPLFPPRATPSLRRSTRRSSSWRGRLRAAAPADAQRGCSSPRTRCCTRAGRRTGCPCLTRTGPRPPYGVDVAEIQDAFARLDNQCLNANCDLWKAIQELREKFAAYRPVPSQYRRNGPGKCAPGSYSTGRGQGRSGPQYRRVGGEGEAPKNE